jgi:hypothetical protein
LMGGRLYNCGCSARWRVGAVPLPSSAGGATARFSAQAAKGRDREVASRMGVEGGHGRRGRCGRGRAGQKQCSPLEATLGLAAPRKRLDHAHWTVTPNLPVTR